MSGYAPRSLTCPSLGSPPALFDVAFSDEPWLWLRETKVDLLPRSTVVNSDLAACEHQRGAAPPLSGSSSPDNCTRRRTDWGEDIAISHHSTSMKLISSTQMFIIMSHLQQ